MQKRIAPHIQGLIALAFAAASVCASAAATAVPEYRVDAAWPQLPNHWQLGQVAAVTVGPDGHVWILQRPRTVAAGQPAAPPVIEFDAAGHFLHAWGGAGAGYDWPSNEHSLALDRDGHVWISGNGPGDDALLKFTRGGQLLLQFGHNRASRGNADRDNLKQAAGIAVYEPTHELFIADGYGNRRLIVLDADTARFKRMWGAFGHVPEDRPPSPPGTPPERYESQGALLDDSGQGSAQFSLPHAVVVSQDRRVYVADRPNRRIQVFTLDGQYLKQVFINRAGPATETACGLALSPDRSQRFLYVADYGNSQVLILDRKSLAVLKVFGSRGVAPGQFRGAHSIALGRDGTLYVTEVAPGNRVQRFLTVTE